MCSVSQLAKLTKTVINLQETALTENENTLDLQASRIYFSDVCRQSK